MRSKFITTVTLLALLPAMAVAQRGGGRTASTSHASGDLSKPPSVRYPTVGDIEDHNPATLLVDRRKKLSLADSTVSQLKALEKVVKERNALMVAMYDSVRRRIVATNQQAISEATPGLQMEDRQNKTGLRNLWAELRDRRAKDAEEALALVPEDRRKAAADYLKEQDDELERRMPGGGDRPGGPDGSR
jgi:hypothetical protein